MLLILYGNISLNVNYVRYYDSTKNVTRKFLAGRVHAIPHT